MEKSQLNLEKYRVAQGYYSYEYCEQKRTN